MEKVLVVLDYPRVEHVVGGVLDYSKTALGKRFSQEIKATGCKNVTFAFLYPAVPEAKRTSRSGKILSYKSPNKAAINEHISVLKNTIDALQPDLIIPTGTLSSTEFAGKKIVSAQGVPVKSFSKLYSGWVLPLFSQEYVESNPTIKINRDMSMRLLERYVLNGDKAFVAERPNYFEVTDMDTVKKVFAKPIETGEFSWDTETNTLYPNRKGSKVLVLSFAWAEGKACAIPLEHAERYSKTGTTVSGDKSIWTPEQLEEIYSMFRNLLSAKTVGDIKTDVKVDNPMPSNTRLIKVGHNITFDEHFLRATGHATEFNNVLDTLIGYFLEVSQESETSRHLSDLAFTMTPLGGYDAPLEDYKKWLMEQQLKVARAAKKLKDELTEDFVRDNITWDFLEEHGYNTRRIQDWVVGVIYHVTKRFGVSPKGTMSLDTLDTSDEFNGDKMTYEWIPMEIMYYYASGDADAALRVHHRILDIMHSDPKDNDGRLMNLYTKFYPELVNALSIVQNNGMHVDDEYLTSLSEVYKGEASKLIDELREYPAIKEFEANHLALYEQGVKEFAKPVAERDKSIVAYRNKYKNGGYKFDPSKPVQRQELFFKQLGYKMPYAKEFITKGVWESGKKEKDLTWKSYSTGKDTIKEMAKLAKKANDTDTVELMEKFSVYSVVAKIGSSFTDNMREFIGQDGCLHGRFSAAGTQTGRLSSSKINLQNIPAAKSDVRLFNYVHPVKRAFNSRFKGGKLLNIDYSSLEMHIMALIANEQSMTDAFLSGQDVHTANASLMDAVPYDDVTKAQRQAAKAVGFGLIYGKQTPALADDLGITIEEAQERVDKFFETKPRVEKFINDTHAFVEENGYVTTLNGFRRNLTGIVSSDYGTRSKALRQSVNTIIQGSGAILTNTSLIILNKALKQLHLRSVIAATVHDSILMDCPEDEIPKVAKLALGIMTNLPYPWLMYNHNGKEERYPIEAEVDIGANYNDEVDYDPELIDQLGYDKYLEYKIKLKRISDAEESEVLTKEQRVFLEKKVTAEYLK